MNKKFDAQQMFIVDDEQVVRQTTNDIEKTWYPTYDDYFWGDIWLDGDILEWPDPDPSFTDMIRLFDDCYSRRIASHPQYVWNRTAEKTLYSYYVHNRKEKPSCSPEGIRELTHSILDILIDRPPNAKVIMKASGWKTMEYYPKDLQRVKRHHGHHEYFMTLLPCTPNEGEQATPTVKGQHLPHKRNIYLNVTAPRLAEVVRLLTGLLDNPEILGKIYVRELVIAPLKNISSRTDTITVKVGSEEGFIAVKAYLQACLGGKQGTFVDDRLPMTDPICPGMSWGQDPQLEDVWDMDESMMRRLGRFLDRVALMISDHKRKKSWFNTKATAWELLEWHHHTIQLQVAQGPAHPEKIKYWQLESLGQLSETLKGPVLANEIKAWFRHAYRYSAKYGDENRSFIGLRARALASVMTDSFSDKKYSISAFLRRLSKDEGIDIFHPHLNTSAPVFRDSDDTLVIDTQTISEENASQDLSSPLAMALPEDASKVSEEGVATSLSKVYIRELKGRPRQVIRASKIEHEQWARANSEQCSAKKELEDELEEL
ncbi:hypothetical protein [Fulvitalea axinellae]|uniref:hypothetical protein n=1 Tax=Fulvitalea axinellae TaxID=1182444 RepID=UPI0030CA4CE1